MFTHTTKKSVSHEPSLDIVERRLIDTSNFQIPPIIPIAFSEIAQKAHKQLCDFFVECTDSEPEFLSRDWLPPGLQKLELKELCRKKKDTYSEFPDYEDDALQFFWKLLVWLEGQKAAKKSPFVAGLTKVDLKDDEICALLKIFKEEFLDGFCNIGTEEKTVISRIGNWFRALFPSVSSDDTMLLEKELVKVVDETIPDNWLLKKFMVYVGMTREIDSKQWYVEFVRVKPEDSPDIPDHFISYLLVNEKDQVLYILHNDVAIRSGPLYNKGENTSKYSNCKRDDNYNERLEKLCLHEFGHAVNHMPWYLKILTNRSPKYFLASKKRDWVSAPALHEHEAWAYAFSIRGIVKSTRSWITRLVEESDDEWYNP
jgi:hypothetical protein